MNEVELQKRLQEFENENKNLAVCYINTSLGKVEMEYGSSNILKRANEVIEMNHGYKSLNSQFNSLFYKREIPELISVKTKEENRFIKFLDAKHIVLVISKEDNVNYAKMKIQLANIATE